MRPLVRRRIVGVTAQKARDEHGVANALHCAAEQHTARKSRDAKVHRTECGQDE
jgi:hypothetical protein